MKKLFLLISLVAFSFYGCNNTQEEPIQEEKQTTDSAKVVEMQKEAKVVDELQRTPYMQFVKDVKIVGKVAIVLFCENFGEYQTLHPSDGLSEEEYNIFWNDIENIKIALSAIPLRLFRQNNELNTIDLSLNGEGTKFYLNIEREKFFEIFPDENAELRIEEYLEAHRDKVDIIFEEFVKKTEK